MLQAWNFEGEGEISGHNSTPVMSSVWDSGWRISMMELPCHFIQAKLFRKQCFIIPACIMLYTETIWHFCHFGDIYLFFSEINCVTSLQFAQYFSSRSKQNALPWVDFATKNFTKCYSCNDKSTGVRWTPAWKPDWLLNIIRRKSNIIC